MPNQNNNEEWNLIGKSLHNYFKTAKVVRVNDVLTAIKDNVDYLISQAKFQGKQEGLEEAYKIFAGNGDDDYLSFDQINKLINQLKNKNNE